MKTWAKICHEESVVFEQEFASEAEAKAFVEGFKYAVTVINETLERLEKAVGK